MVRPKPLRELFSTQVSSGTKVVNDPDLHLTSDDGKSTSYPKDRVSGTEFTGVTLDFTRKMESTEKTLDRMN